MKNLLLSTLLVGAAVIGAAAPLFAEDAAMRPWADPEKRFSLVLPEGWWIEGAGPLVSLSSPEGDIALWFGLSEATDAAEAVTAAWAAVGETRATPQTVAPAPPRDGFEAATVFVYPPDGDVIRQAVVESREGRLHVTLIRGSMAALDRRGAQVNIAVTGFQPAGVAAVDLTGVVPDALDAADVAMLGAYIEDNLARFDVPGAVVAVVQGGEVRLLRGFGARSLGSDAP
jgi:CubicO group peptidase (beta-lactamase class C family)